MFGMFKICFVFLRFSVALNIGSIFLETIKGMGRVCLLLSLTLLTILSKVIRTYDIEITENWTTDNGWTGYGWTYSKLPFLASLYSPSTCNCNVGTGTCLPGWVQERNLWLPSLRRGFRPSSKRSQSWFLCPLEGGHKEGVLVLELDHVKFGVTLPCNDNLGKKCHSLSSNAACLKLFIFLYLQGSVVVLKGSSDWTSAPEDAEKYYIADLQTYCPEQPFNFAYGLSIFFAVRYILNHNSKKQIKNNKDKSQIINAHCTCTMDW